MPIPKLDDSSQSSPANRQLEEKSKELGVREKQLESATEREAALSSRLQNLTEEVEKLRLKSSSSSSSSSSTNDLVESLKEEFSRRLGNTEKRLQAVTKERDELKKGQSFGDQAKGVVKAKDDEINALRTEGTNLSLKILERESTLKKYRERKKEDDASLASLREKLSQAETLLEKRNDRVKQLEFSEKKYLGELLLNVASIANIYYSETITTMKDVSDIATRKLEKKESELAQAQKQIQDLQVWL
jgi:chromosome segregation ATPase